ncbi:MAG: pyruvate, water dikinase [Bacteroidota bacterium]|nr:pyruvate, water dikinase [Bacteroidota bacterium]
MSNQIKSMDRFIRALEERAKELNCLYKAEELLSNQELNICEVLDGILKAIPPGWQYPDFCTARIIFDEDTYLLEGFKETPWRQKSDIKVQDEIVGTVEVFYTEEMPQSDEGPFLKEERKLIDTITERLGHYILHLRLRKAFSEWQAGKDELADAPKPEWSIVLDMLRRTDQHLFSIISKKMINNLFFRGIEESIDLFRKLGSLPEEIDSISPETNRPSKKKVLENSFNLGVEIFSIASKYMKDEEILSYIQKWIYEDKCNFLSKALANQNTPLAEVSDAIRKFYHLNPDQEEKSSPVSKGLRVALIRRFLTDQLKFIDIAKNYIKVSDFYELIQKIIFPSESHGKLGGKSAGLFLANNILKNSLYAQDLLSVIKIPKTWYVTSDGLTNFIYYNNLEDVVEQKYKDIDLVRQEYPHIIQAFKNSNFSPEIINGLSRALDDFEGNPIIVRSSSLLEDRMGAAFAGKYKSLFLANQGTKRERLDALMDAISEVYASTFGPDPIGYRVERGLLDFNEEMGIMIQEVVGRKIGKYFFPAFAGVAFSNNEFRWSARIKREDGLIRIVPGLGTRAVDRIGDDYPILLAPGQPDLRVNLTYDEMYAYSPKNVDVINLEINEFETIPLRKLIVEAGNDYPLINEVFSIREERHIRKPVGLGIDTKKHEIVVTFENLFTNTLFIIQIYTILQTLSEKLSTPVDIEFACDGKNLFLLQCRPQSYSIENVSALIPKDVSPERIIFTANKYISNGRLPDITHIVYIDSDYYSLHSELSELLDVGKAVGKLNKILPEKKFILMGPGRWGSRDDVRLGVKVSYSEINKTALLVEMARKKGGYTPDLSFGTHFFQDLVEASIRYLPLYPDDEGIIFNEKFFKESPNIFPEIMPEYEYLSNTIIVIDVPKVTRGLVLRVLLNADDDEAMAILTDPATKPVYSNGGAFQLPGSEEPLRWKMKIVEGIASSLNPQIYGVKDLYVFTSSIDEYASHKSDIDLVVHFDGTPKQKLDLEVWLDGWSKCLREVNFLKSGYYVDNLLDVKFVTDEDFRNNSLIVQRMNTSHDYAKKLKLRE